MTTFPERVESVEIVSKVLDALVVFTPDQVGRSGSDFRRSVGDLRAHTRDLMLAGTIGTNLLTCFDAAVTAGASFESIDLTRLRILEEAPIYTLGKLMRATAVVFAAVEQSRLVADMEFFSRTEVRLVLNRMTALFDIVKVELADAMDSSSYQTITALAASVASHLAATQLLLPEIVTFEFSPGQPALALSQQIYGDGSRSDELILENRVPHPAFMPGTVRALNS